MIRRCVAAAALCLVAGCGIVNWSVSNSGDACQNQKSTIPCP